MTETQPLVPAAELAAKGSKPFPNESPEYGKARTKLLAEEIELRRQIQRVAALRRSLPSGGEAKAYRFLDENQKELKLADLFGRHDTLFPLAMAEEMKKGIPGSQLAVFEESGHAPQLEEPERFNEVVGAFLGNASGVVAKPSAAKPAPPPPAPKPAVKVEPKKVEPKKAEPKKAEPTAAKKAVKPAAAKPEKKKPGKSGVAGKKKPGKSKR